MAKPWLQPCVASPCPVVCCLWVCVVLIPYRCAPVYKDGTPRAAHVPKHNKHRCMVAWHVVLICGRSCVEPRSCMCRLHARLKKPCLAHQLNNVFRHAVRQTWVHMVRCGLTRHAIHTTASDRTANVSHSLRYEWTHNKVCTQLCRCHTRMCARLCYAP